jgi:hypothetical protein
MVVVVVVRRVIVRVALGAGVLVAATGLGMRAIVAEVGVAISSFVGMRMLETLIVVLGHAVRVHSVFTPLSRAVQTRKMPTARSDVSRHERDVQ